jgi:hypothetical protein
MDFKNLKPDMEELSLHNSQKSSSRRRRTFKTTNQTYQTIHKPYRNIFSHHTIDPPTTDKI